MNYLRRVWETRTPVLWLALMRLVMGYEWLRAGFDKVRDPEFSAGFPKTLGFFAAQNPNAWYANFINSVAVPNAKVFGILVSYGELLVGLSLLLGLLTYVGAFFGLVMNLNYFFAASHLGASTYGLNVVMFAVTLILILGGACKLLSLDGFLAPRVLRLLPWSRRCVTEPVTG